jgi:hypothetical protein
MNRTILCALATVLSVAIVTPAFAQSDNFPDVPDNHWAYDALKNMKAAGVLVGYPDGLFRGSRPASRYELAVAVNAAYTRLKAITDGLDGQIKAINDKLSGYASQQDLQNLRDALTALQNDVNSMKGWGEDIANLKRLADTFQKELQSLGVDVEAMKKDLGDLANRVTILEKRKPAVNISGDLNLWMGAGNSRDNDYGLNMDGRINGNSLPNNPALGSPVGLDRDLVFLHEGAFNFSGTNDTGPKWAGTVVVGNMLGGVNPGDGFGNQSQGGGLGFGYAQGQEDVYIQNFSVIFNTSIAGLAFNTDVGRVGYKISPYIYQRMDRTSYFSNERWDNGKYYFDGGILGFNLGGAKLDVFAGNTPANSLSGNAGASVVGTPLDPVVSGPVNGPFAPGGAILLFNRQLGGNLNIPLTSAGNLNLAYLWLDTDSTSPTSLNANRLSVYGGTVNLHFGQLKLEGGYAGTDLQYNTSNILTNNNNSYYGKAAIGSDKWGIWGGYRVVEANFLAPGDWGRLGVLRNPTNIEGFQVGGHLDLTHAITLKADGEFDKGKDNGFATTTGFGTGTDIDKYSVSLGYKATSNLSFYVGYEDDMFKNLVNPGAEIITGNPNYQWATIGLNYGLSDSAKLTIQYQLSDVKHDYQVSDDGTFRGGFLTSQLTIKF